MKAHRARVDISDISFRRWELVGAPTFHVALFASDKQFGGGAFHLRDFWLDGLLRALEEGIFAGSLALSQNILIFPAASRSLAGLDDDDSSYATERCSGSLPRFLHPSESPSPCPSLLDTHQKA